MGINTRPPDFYYTAPHFLLRGPLAMWILQRFVPTIGFTYCHKLKLNQWVNDLELSLCMIEPGAYNKYSNDYFVSSLAELCT